MAEEPGEAELGDAVRSAGPSELDRKQETCAVPEGVQSILLSAVSG